MNLIIGKEYKLRIKIGDRVLTYTCKILQIDTDFVTFEDKFGETHSYNRSTIMSYSEVENGN
jgi:hypothetical protein